MFQVEFFKRPNGSFTLDFGPVTLHRWVHGTWWRRLEVTYHWWGWPKWVVRLMRRAG